MGNEVEMFCLRDNLLVELVFEKLSSVIDTSEAKEEPMRFGIVIGRGPDVDSIELGDEVLIPQRSEGRTVIEREGKKLAVFAESDCRLGARLV